MRIDYTTRGEGTAISSRGTIQRCPVCGRMGERQPNSAKSKPWKFVHVVEALPSPSKGTKITVIDKCTSPSAGSAPVAAQPKQMVLGR